MSASSRFSTTSNRFSAVHRRGRDRGFTLLELLVSITIFLIIVMILVSFTASIGSLWQQGISHNERRSAALVVLGKLRRDLRYASLPSDLSSSSLRFEVNPASVSPAYCLPQSLFWQSPTASDRTQGDLAAVGYFVQWVADGTGMGRPKLSRFFANPATNSFTGYSSPGNWISDAQITANAPGTRASGYLGEIAENVLGLWVCPLDQQGQPITSDTSGASYTKGQFDSRRGYLSGTNPVRSYPNSLPASIEVAVMTVDSRTAKLLSGNEKPALSGLAWANTAAFYSDVNAFFSNLPPKIQKGAEIHSTVIDLANSPR